MKYVLFKVPSINQDLCPHFITYTSSSFSLKKKKKKCSCTAMRCWVALKQTPSYPGSLLQGSNLPLLGLPMQLDSGEGSDSGQFAGSQWSPQKEKSGLPQELVLWLKLTPLIWWSCKGLRDLAWLRLKKLTHYSMGSPPTELGSWVRLHTKSEAVSPTCWISSVKTDLESSTFGVQPKSVSCGKFFF